MIERIYRVVSSQTNVKGVFVKNKGVFELNFVNEKDIPQVVVEGVCVCAGGS